LKYTNKYTVNVTGLQNTGVICYFNSLLQSLLSCTSLNQYIINAPHTITSKSGQPIERNKVWKLYYEMIKSMMTNTNDDLSFWSVQLWTTLMENLSKNKKYSKFGKGQEDAHEGFLILIDALNDLKIDKLFEHRFRTTIDCKDCQHTCSRIVDESFVIDIYPEELSKIDKDPIKALEMYIKKYNPSIDNNYKCPFENCGKKGNKTQTRELTMLPEILILQFKKYNKKILIDFPEQLKFVNTDTKKITFQLVSQVEHSGTMSGGHYWSLSLRKDGKVFNCNDNSFSNSDWAPSNETYMVFYHIL
jgi:ubiquitin C-terminal hydrolase